MYSNRIRKITFLGFSVRYRGIVTGEVHTNGRISPLSKTIIEGFRIEFYKNEIFSKSIFHKMHVDGSLERKQ